MFSVLVIAAVVLAWVVFKPEDKKGPFPECSASSLATFRQQIQAYYDGNGDVAGYRDIHGECAFSETYAIARMKFLDAASSFENIKLSRYEITDGLYIDVAEVPGDPKRVVMSTSGVHGPEGFAGSAIQTSVLSMLSETPTMRKAYTDGGTDDDHRPPTLLFIHAVNPYGFANNRRFNEDNIDLNRNFLTDEKFTEVYHRDPNFAGYVDIDFMINPSWMPFGTITPLNDLWGHLKSAVAVAVYGLTNIKRALVAGNYFRQSGLGFGGFKRSKSVETLIEIAKEKKIHEAERVILIDHHTGLGPSGTDTLALLGQNDPEFNSMIESTFPLEMDGGQIVGGDKASDVDGSAMSGYELTIGTMKHYCETWMHPTGDHNKDIICLTQEFGTVPVIEVGKAQIEENFAYHHGTEEQKRVYGARLKGVFYVETQKWMRNVAHRGLILWNQAYNFIRK